MKALLTPALVAIALLTLPSDAHAAPFTPDLFQFDVINVAWDSSGTDTFCS